MNPDLNQPQAPAAEPVAPMAPPAPSFAEPVVAAPAPMVSEPVAEAPVAPMSTPAPVEFAKPKSNKKLMMIALAVVGLAVVVVLAYFLLGNK